VGDLIQADEVRDISAPGLLECLSKYLQRIGQ
jgi:hypothetical protein